MLEQVVKVKTAPKKRKHFSITYLIHLFPYIRTRDQNLVFVWLLVFLTGL